MFSSSSILRHALFATSIAAVLALSGCVLAPAGTREHQQKLDENAGQYRQPFEARNLPELPPQPAWNDVLRRAFLANGELEAAYFDWAAAVTRVRQAGAWPNTNVSLSFEYMFSSEKMKSWDRTTVGAGFDPMSNLSFPTKTMKSAEAALAAARASGERFRAAKFSLQSKVLIAWNDYVLQSERIRIQQSHVDLLAMLVETANARVQAGGQQQDLLKAQIERQLAENELADMQAELPQMRAMLNAMLARPSDASLASPAQLPPARALYIGDADLIRIASDEIPQLAALQYDVDNRQRALELARMQFIPDINPMAGFTGSIEQFIGAGITLPTIIPIIRSAIAESDAMLRGTQAMARQTRADLAGRFVATLFALRNNQRQVEFLTARILPAADQLLDSSRQAYSTANIDFADLVESQRTVLQVKLQIAEARIAREKRLVELESLLGTDLETLENQEIDHE